MSADSFAIETLPSELRKPENAPLLGGILRGIEKESLRVSAEGVLSLTDHPKALGAALTHPKITTDFSEALLEFITPPSHCLPSLFEQLEAVHDFTYRNLGREMLWASSMPCSVGEANSIPVARYGTSNRGRMKTVYRVGLGHRYGRVMQTVAGVHYNFSLPRAFWAFLHQQEGSGQDLKEFIDSRYFDLIRNFRRYYWLLLYLFGASPAFCRSFVSGREHDLQAMGPEGQTLYLPHATSLRMGDLGYQSRAQESLYVCYNALSTYANTLGESIFKPFAPYSDMGLFDAAGQRKQLNTSLLQIENEFYSSIRPKRTAEAGETALTALCQRGVEYIEVRCLDLDPFSPLGVSQEQVRFLDTFLMYCLFKSSPACHGEEAERIIYNHKRVVQQGRDPKLQLVLPDGGNAPLRQWGQQLLEAMAPVAQLLDRVHKSEAYTQSLAVQQGKIKDAQLTPSAKVLHQLNSKNGSFTRWGKELSAQFKAAALAKAENLDVKQHMALLARESLSKQKLEESEAEPEFEQYLESYYAQYKSCCDI